MRRSRVKLFDCSFFSNTAEDPGGEDAGGGAVRIQEAASEVDFDSCRFVNNHATFGGGVYAGIESGVLLTKCSFNGNSAR